MLVECKTRVEVLKSFLVLEKHENVTRRWRVERVVAFPPVDFSSPVLFIPIDDFPVMSQWTRTVRNIWDTITEFQVVCL